MITAGQVLPEEQANKSTVVTTGFALFSMFFGAGNLIFPLLIGKSMGKNVWYAVLGLGLTAVIVPFLGLTSMIFFKSDYHRFFNRVGAVPGALLLLLLQLVLGPVGVIPRLITLMHATSKPFLSGMSLGTFSVIAVVIVFVCSFKREMLIGFLGRVLTPILLISLTVLFYFGITEGSTMPIIANSASDSFFEGLFGGYNTMDLIAAFMFATIILPHFQEEIESEHLPHARQALFKKMGLSSLIAASLLFFTYAGLCLISAHHASSLDASYPAEQMLGIIANKFLGPIGGCVAAVAVVIACLTTAMTLSSIFADYLRVDICKEKIGPTGSLIFTLTTAMLFANLGFGGIAAFLGPLLQIIYPGLILLTMLNLLHSLYGFRIVKIPVFLAFATSAVIYLIQK